MKGMHYEYGFVYSDDDYTASYHWELPPTSTILQLSLSSLTEGWDKYAWATLGFTHVEYLDSNGVPRHEDYPVDRNTPTALSVNGLTRVDWEIGVLDTWVNWLLNAFFWNSVY